MTQWKAIFYVYMEEFLLHFASEIHPDAMEYH